MQKLINGILKPIYLLIIVSLISCKDLIETDLPYNQIGKNEVFTDVSSANAALSGLYAELWNSSVISGDISGSGAILGTYTDDLTCYAPYIQNGLLDIYNNIQIPSNTIIYSYWSRAYKHIYYANSIIEGVSQSQSISQSDKQRLIGETVAIRSLLYYYLTEVFDEIPYTDSTSFEQNSTIKKISKEELYLRLEQDIKSIISGLNDNYNNLERIYINRNVAQLILAKIFMQQQKWQEAETILQQIINSPLYIFENDITKVFLKTGKHILWQLKPANSTDATKEYLLYNFSNSVPTSFALSNVLVNSFESGDLRKQNWIIPVVVNQNTYYRPMKYKNPINSNTTENSIVFRLEEVYLLYAESLTRQNKVNEAKILVDKIRQRAGLNNLAPGISQAEMLSSIEKEFRHEFFAEMGQRFFTLKRLNMLNKISLSKPNWQPFHQAFPLPEIEIIINPNLNPQNQGY